MSHGPSVTFDMKFEDPEKDGGEKSKNEFEELHEHMVPAFLNLKIRKNFLFDSSFFES